MYNNTKSKKHVYNLATLEPKYKFYLQEVLHLQKSSVKNYISDLRYFNGWYISTFHSYDIITSVTQNTINEYKSYLVHSMLPVKTVNRRLSSIRSFYRFAVDTKIMTSNPTIGVTNLSKTSQKQQQGRKIRISSHESTLGHEHGENYAKPPRHYAKILSEFSQSINANVHSSKLGDQGPILSDLQEFFDVVSDDSSTVTSRKLNTNNNANDISNAIVNKGNCFQ